MIDSWKKSELNWCQKSDTCSGTQIMCLHDSEIVIIMWGILGMGRYNCKINNQPVCEWVTASLDTIINYQTGRIQWNLVIR